MTAVGAHVAVERPFDEVVSAVRDALADQGFGVLTEIDVRATMRAKLDVEVSPQVILGACNPPLALRALEAEPSIGVLLPCNVVVRAGDDGCVVEAVEPRMLVDATTNDDLAAIAREAGTRLEAALSSLPKS